MLKPVPGISQGNMARCALCGGMGVIMEDMDPDAGRPQPNGQTYDQERHYYAACSTKDCKYNAYNLPGASDPLEAVENWNEIQGAMWDANDHALMKAREIMHALEDGITLDLKQPDAPIKVLKYFGGAYEFMDRLSAAPYERKKHRDGMTGHDLLAVLEKRR